MTIVEAVIEGLRTTGRDTLWWGDCDLLDHCAQLAGLYDRPGCTHPMAIHTRILNALDRHPAFHKSYLCYAGHRTRCFTYVPPESPIARR